METEQRSGVATWLDSLLELDELASLGREEFDDQSGWVDRPSSLESDDRYRPRQAMQ